MKKPLAGCVSIFVLISTRAIASDELFQAGQHEATLVAGGLFSPVLSDSGRSSVNYSYTGLQLGWMLGDVRERGWLRGNFEFVAEGFGCAIYQGSGSYIAGGTVWLRYNFVQPGWRVTPFVQGGAGLLATDTDRELIGQTLNFNLDTSAGLRYHLAANWSINVEYRYQHISNAKLSDNDIGINAHGPLVGISCFF
jgi:opacity protein-like surface antigen